MKNLKKVLALVLALGMILSTFTALTTVSAEEADTTADEVVAETTEETAEDTAEEAEEAEEEVVVVSDSAYSFSDVEGTEYAEAAEVLNALGIANGYEDGTFGGEKTVTRAEMAAFIVREIGLREAAESAAANSTSFSDVAATHWATGSINIANEKNIINGLGDGRFAPDKTVEYQAAVKMLVCALGYNVVATRNGGWPQGYIIAGAQIGLTDGITGVAGTDGCSRGVVAQLLFNALEIGLMEETVYAGSAVQIEEVCETLLYDKLGVIKLFDAEIVGTPTQGVRQKDGIVKFTGTKSYWNNLGQYVDYPVAQTVTCKINGLDPDKFFGDSVIVYFKENKENQNHTLLCILEDEVRQETFELSVADLYSNNRIVAKGEAAYDGKVNNYDEAKVFYKTEDDSKAKYIETVAIPAVVINGETQKIDSTNVANFLNWFESLENGTIKFIDAKTKEDDTYGPDGIYEKIIFNTYWDFVVSEVDAEDGDVATRNNDIIITLDDDKIFSIVDTEGEELKVSDLKENDVMSVYPNSLYNSADINDAKVIKIVVSNDTVEGVVTEITSKGLYLDDEFYKTDKKDASNPNDNSIVDVSDFTLGEEGTYFLNAEGVIVYAETIVSASNHALVYDAYAEGAKKVMLSVITPEGEQAELEVRNSVDVIEFAADGNGGYSKTKTEYSYSKGNLRAVESLIVNKAYDAKGNFKPYVLGYNLKSGSEVQVDEIYFAFDGIKSVTGKKPTYFGIWADAEDGTYYTATKFLAGHIVDSSTVIYDIPSSVKSLDDIDDVKVITPKNEDKFEYIKVYEKDKNGVAKIMVVSSEQGEVDYKDAISIIRNITTAKNADGDTVYKLYLLKNGKEVVKLTENLSLLDDYGANTDTTGYTPESLAIGYDFYPGAVIFYKEDTDGAISNIAKIYPVPSKNSYVDADGNPAPYYVADYFTTWQNSIEKKSYNDNADCFIVYGKVTEKNTTTGRITVDTKKHDGTYADEINKTGPNTVADTVSFIYSSANVTVVDYNLSDVEEQIATGSLQDVKKGSYVLVRTYNSVVKDIVVYKNFNPDNAKARF